MDGWTLSEARDISADGKTIVGAGVKDGKELPFVVRLAVGRSASGRWIRPSAEAEKRLSF